MHDSGYNAKQAQEDRCDQETDAPPPGEYRKSTLREEAEKNARHYAELEEREFRAAVFFRDNPKFDEFVRLIRSGAIRI